MNHWKTGAGAVLFATLLCVLFAEMQFRAETRREIKKLQAELKRLSSIPPAPPSLPSTRERVDPEPASNAMSTHAGAEIAELREEVAQLQKTLAEAQSAMNATSNSLVALKPKEIPFVYPDAVKRADYAFIGHATPEAALQSVLWSISHLDARAFRASIGGDFENAFANDFKELPEGVMPGGFQNGDMYRAAGFRVMEVLPASADEITLKVFLEGRRTILKPVFQRVNGEWKLVRNALR